MIHYEAFKRAIDLGVFDSDPVVDNTFKVIPTIDSYLRNLPERAKYYGSLNNSETLENSFGLGLEEIQGCMDAFMERAVYNGKALPLDGLVRVENDSRVIFIENSPIEDNTLQLTMYRDVPKYEQNNPRGLFCSAKAKMTQDRRNMDFFDIWLGVVTDDTYNLLEETEKIETACDTLEHEAGLAILELAYLDQKGMIPGKDKFLQ